MFVVSLERSPIVARVTCAERFDHEFEFVGGDLRSISIPINLLNSPKVARWFEDEFGAGCDDVSGSRFGRNYVD